jgi:alkanesulfonate monooxygenase SsuD/methylene tetrahydromethanopterin reductase-like flavin-dependent oxidoreductase (luciferase family)
VLGLTAGRLRRKSASGPHIGEGRFGLNLVCGWNEGEFEMFGATSRDHEARYDYAQEWLDIVKLVPLPTPDPTIVNTLAILRPP